MTTPTPHNDFIVVPGVGNVGPNEYLELRDALAAERARVAGLASSLKEAVDLVDAIRSGEYIPDSFTTQPWRAALETGQ